MLVIKPNHFMRLPVLAPGMCPPEVTVVLTTPLGVLIVTGAGLEGDTGLEGELGVEGAVVVMGGGGRAGGG